MTLLIALVVIIGAILLVVAVLAMRNRDPLAEMRNNAASAPQRDPFDEVTGAAEFGPDRLAPGAIIVYGATDYVVRGTLVVQQGPFTWYEHLLDGGDGASWLGVEVDEGQLELVWWTTRKQALHPQSLLDFEGVTYHEGERGHAQYRSIGTTGLPQSGEMRYIDMADSTGELRLGFEGWANDDSWEMSTGRVVLPGEFTVYPAPK
ncbi:DUF4178 domain-containing protein [Corynebacterium durum]|uniref:DUF4178 domain-containing protein n=1 Tax=Corynebacterium durum TaxID=61592 RepID=UPI0028EC2396|nr:DUF4178 domain-containing protein [Corynebacterium durum]